MAGLPRRGALWIGSALILAALIVLVATWGDPLYRFAVNQDQIQAWVVRLGPWGPLGIIALQVAQTLLAPIPGQAIGAISGVLYGTWRGTLYAMAGLLIGSLTAFLLARSVGRPILRRLVSEPTLAQLDDLARRGGPLFFFLIWLFPLTPDDLACLAAGLTPMTTRQFLILVTLGRLPGVWVTVWAGANATQIAPIGWAALLAGIGLLVLGLWLWRDPIQTFLLHLLERIARPARQ